MKNRHLFWGIVLVTIGGIFLFRNFGWLDISWGNILYLWPLILVLIGASILPTKVYYRIAIALAYITAYTIVATSTGHHRPCIRSYFDRDYSYHHQHRDKQEKEDIEIEDKYVLDIKKADLNIEAGAGTFDIKGFAEELIDFNKFGNDFNYEITQTKKNNKVVVDIDQRALKKNNVKGNGFELKLNKGPVWDLSIEAGAANMHVDLKEFKVSSVDVEGGAMSLDLTLGDKYPDTRVSIESGATNIDISVPESSGCEIHASTFLASKSFQGFEKVKRGVYRTANFDKSEKKIIMNIESAVSSINVKRY